MPMNQDRDARDEIRIESGKTEKVQIKRTEGSLKKGLTLRIFCHMRLGTLNQQQLRKRRTSMEPLLRVKMDLCQSDHVQAMGLGICKRKGLFA